MRGELDDALARLRRWNEVRQRLAGEPVGDLPEPAGPFVPEAAAAPPPVPMPGAPMSSQPMSAPPVSAPPSPQQYAMSTEVVPTSPAPGYPTAPEVLPPAHLVNAEVPQQPNPATAAQLAQERGPVLPRSVEDVLNAIGDVMRQHTNLTVTVAVDDGGSGWRAQIVQGEDGQPMVARLEPRGVHPSGGVHANGGTHANGGGHAGGAGHQHGGHATVAGQTAGGGAPPQWPPAGRVPAEAGRPAEAPRPATIGRPGEAPERTASRLAELVRRDPSLLDPPEGSLR